MPKERTLPDPKKLAEIEQLVALSKNGDSEAFTKLYDNFINPIYRYIYYRVGPNEAEDLTELVFLKIWENLHQYEAGRRNFSSWIFRIAHNVVVDHYRSFHHKDELSDQVADHREEAKTTRMAEQRLTNDILNEAMKELKDNYRQILILKYINDMSNEEIAYVMGRSQAALRILQFRALKKLKVVLEERGISSADL